ncbi:acyl homoserine lactone synthase [Oxalobacteraceae bacterium GrIS 1.11]
MKVISGKTNTLPKVLQSQVASYRYKVFIETLNWDLDAENGEEFDQFDHEDTVYIVSQDEQGRVNGCARLLPSSRPYLLGEIFPQLALGAPAGASAKAPANTDVWELSRFAAVDFNQQSRSPLARFSSPNAVKLMHEAIACAAAQGARRLITVSPIGIERLLRRVGLHAHRADPPMIVDGHPIFACWIDVLAPRRISEAAHARRSFPLIFSDRANACGN